MILRALVDGLQVRVDPIHTTPADELAARLDGREVLWAYRLHPAPRLAWRWHWHMRPDAKAAGAPVLLEHDCRRWPPRDDPPDLRLFSLPPAPAADLEEPPW